MYTHLKKQEEKKQEGFLSRFNKKVDLATQSLVLHRWQHAAEQTKREEAMLM